MKGFCLMLGALMLLAAGCATSKTSTSKAAARIAPENVAVPAELTQPEFVSSVLAYLYMWHELALPPKGHAVEARVRVVNIKTDEGDTSRFAELWAPEAGVVVHLKKADHAVPERHLEIRDDRYRISAVEPKASVPLPATGWTKVQVSAEQIYRQMKAPGQSVFPRAALGARVREALQKWLQKQNRNGADTVPQTFYIAPFSEVASRIWVFWENERAVVQISADGGFDNPGLWEQQAAQFRLIKLHPDAGGASEHARGPELAASASWSGRVLYNCVILGTKIAVTVD